MEMPAVGGGGVVSTGEPTSRGFNDLASEDFFALLIAELQSQDPLNPMDNRQFLEQMSSIRQMEQSSKLNATLESLASAQRFGATAGLIGHYVAGTVRNEAGESFTIEGLVIGVRYEANGGAILELHNGQSLPVEAVEQVTLLENLPQDVLDALQADLDMPAGDGEPGDEPVSLPTARVLTPDAAAANSVRSGAELLASLVSPGLSVGI